MYLPESLAMLLRVAALLPGSFSSGTACGSLPVLGQGFRTDVLDIPSVPGVGLEHGRVVDVDH